MSRDLPQLHQRAPKVDIRTLKEFAFQRLPDCALRDVLLAEQDFLNVDEFLTKMEIYLKLLRRVRQ